MTDSKKFTLSRLSEAAYLEGVARIRCLDIEIDPADTRRVVFVFDISPEEGRKLVLKFGSSEAAAFDASIKNFKGKIYQRLRETNADRN